jgi:hypothetical protein
VGKSGVTEPRKFRIFTIQSKSACHKKTND